MLTLFVVPTVYTFLGYQGPQAEADRSAHRVPAE
jgi:hypothetical protein